MSFVTTTTFDAQNGNYSYAYLNPATVDEYKNEASAESVLSMFNAQDLHAFHVDKPTATNLLPVSAASSSRPVIGTVTVQNILTPSSVGLDGIIYSISQPHPLSSFGTALVLHTTAIPISKITRPRPQPLALLAITLSTYFVTADSVSGFVTDFQTLVP